MSLGILETCLGQEPPRPTTNYRNINCYQKYRMSSRYTTCANNPIQPSNFTIVIEGNNPSQNNFPGSSTGTDVELELGAYNVTEQGLDPVTPAICRTMGFEAGQVVSTDISGTCLSVPISLMNVKEI